ncbi:MAG TPA: DMT family transporter [Spirochaetia bacterium]|nr:DMT family transporter [Spirochaetia bacterium]
MHPYRSTLRTDSLLLLTAGIWGFAFVAQRAGMGYVGPFLYNAVRFALGTLSLLPVIAFRRAAARRSAGNTDGAAILRPAVAVGWMVLAGVVLFAASSLQQVGIVTTSAGKAGFITGLYVVLVPLIGGFLGRRSDVGRWVGALLAAGGLYLLSVTEKLTVAPGDLLLLLCAVFFTVHVLLIDRISPHLDPIVLSAIQSGVTAVLSFVVAIIFEPVSVAAVANAWGPIAYGGIMSVGVAYSLQIVAQRTAHPTHAAILLSLEGTFAAIGGFLILGEMLSTRNIVGCALMLAGMLLAQLSATRRDRRTVGAQGIRSS